MSAPPPPSGLGRGPGCRPPCGGNYFRLGNEQFSVFVLEDILQQAWSRTSCGEVEPWQCWVSLPVCSSGGADRVGLEGLCVEYVLLALGPTESRFHGVSLWSELRSDPLQECCYPMGQQNWKPRGCQDSSFGHAGKRHHIHFPGPGSGWHLVQRLRVLA